MRLYILAGDVTEETPINTCKLFTEKEISKNIDKMVRVNLPDIENVKRENGYFILNKPGVLRDISHDIVFKFNDQWKERNDLKELLPLYNAQHVLVREEGYHYSSRGFVKTVRQ